jgi:hypothetical protein
LLQQAGAVAESIPETVLEVKTNLGIALAKFRDGMEAVFEQDVLRFASDRYQCEPTKTWEVGVAHVDSADWIDLFRVSRHSFMESGAENWAGCDAWSLTWDLRTPTGWAHAARPERERLVPRLELDSFDPTIARWAPRYDLVTFLQDDLLRVAANDYQMSEAEYLATVLCHESLHSVSDWIGKPLVVDGVLPSQDREVVETLAAFARSAGGLGRYLL